MCYRCYRCYRLHLSNSRTTPPRSDVVLPVLREKTELVTRNFRFSRFGKRMRCNKSWLPVLEAKYGGYTAKQAAVCQVRGLIPHLNQRLVEINSQHDSLLTEVTCWCECKLHAWRHLHNNGFLKQSLLSTPRSARCGWAIDEIKNTVRGIRLNDTPDE